MCVIQRWEWSVEVQGAGDMKAATKTCPQCPCAFPDTQRGEMITCGSMGNTHLFTTSEQWNSVRTEKCEFPRLLTMVLLCKPKASIILFENWLKVKRFCSIGGSSRSFKTGFLKSRPHANPSKNTDMRFRNQKRGFAGGAGFHLKRMSCQILCSGELQAPKWPWTGMESRLEDRL